MSDKRQWISIGGLVATLAIVAYTVVQLYGQDKLVPTGDFTNAAVAEVRDAQGQVLLRGHFQPVEEADDDIERKAALEPVGADRDATGEAEVEFSKATPIEQEVEFEVKQLDPGARVTFVIDGKEVATVTVDDDGTAEFEADIEMNPQAAGSR